MKTIIVIFTFLVVTASSYSFDLTLSSQKGVKDYAPIIEGYLRQIVENGGGTLRVSYGQYPILKAINLKETSKTVSVLIKGITNSQNHSPLFFDTNRKETPHSFLVFEGNIGIPNLTVAIENISIEGNNVSYSANHPFINKTIYSRAIACLNTNTVRINNVEIKNFYGDGIMISQGMDTRDKRFRVNKPTIKNCKILNTWGWGPIDDSKDAIMLWQVNEPVVENCIILNDVSVTKARGRCGIVLEHNSENAVIRNNTIGGYDRNIHIECDFGGHKITNNFMKFSNNAITLSYDCAQSIAQKNQYSPILIESNTFSYLDELKKISNHQNDFGFISIHKKSFVLSGLKIKGNRFNTVKTSTSKKLISDNSGVRSSKIYIRLSGQENVTIQDNIYE